MLGGGGGTEKKRSIIGGVERKEGELEGLKRGKTVCRKERPTARRPTGT